uniref:glycoside hydrolase family 10 protein n=1 Tax=Eubacterium sp. TaxID=142586 RepID=UPI00402A1D71
TQGEEMNYDPLQIMCELSDKYKLKIEAWINPYRVSQDNDYSKLCENNIALKWHNSENTKEYVKEYGNKLYFNPAYKEVNELIVNGVKEIAENYSVDGIHFDDYFYPTSDADFDSVAYDEYKKKGGDLSLGDWRRDNVSSLIKSVYKAIKKVNPDIRFGVSPASDIENDYTSLYADIEKWVSEDGYVDYVCPQIYFGFRNVKQPFMFITKKWVALMRDSKVDLYVGLPLYKCSKVDDYAASEDESIKNEFVDNHDIISRQIIYLSKLDKIKGYYIFSYSYLDDDEIKDEVSLMRDAVND